MLLTYLMLGVALSLSAIAAFYSIVGLAAIFAAAVIPIIIMGSILEIAKLVVTVWLHEHWRQCRLLMKCYLVPAVGILMLITSMGIFGFLSKAHLDQAVPAGDISAKVQIYDEKIRTQRDNIEAARAALRQLDAAVDQTMSRSNDEKGADRAVQIRRQQAGERNRLQNDISRAQTEITKLQEQRAPIAAEARRVEAEVGPVKYIAALIYGDNPDASLLEKAVRWVIIILVVVFDPLAIMMLLAFTESYRWNREQEKNKKSETDNDPMDDVDVPATTDMDQHLAQPDVVVDSPTKSEQPIEFERIGEPDEDPIEAYVSQPLSIETPATETPATEYLFEKHRDPRITLGQLWPPYPNRGDLFVKTSTLPTTLYKYNGEIWIEIDKSQNDLYYHNDEYITYLIEKISSGEYDPELLNYNERDQIEQRLRKGVQ